MIQNTNDNVHKSKSKQFNLLKYILIFHLFTIFLYFAGPVEWKTQNTFLTFLLVILYLLALGFGNKFGEKNYKTIQIKGFWNTKNFLKYYTVFALITIVLKIISLQRIVHLYGWDNAFSIVENIFKGNLSALYYTDKLVSSGAEMYGGSFFSIVSLLFSPITIVLFPISLVYFSKFNFSQKIIAIVLIITYSLASIAQGTTEGFYIIIVYAFVGFLLKPKKTKKIKSSTSSRKIIIIFFAILILVAFNTVMKDRMKDTTNFAQLGVNNILYENNWLYSIMPKSLKNLLIWTDVYLCQGYYGMSLATTLNWVPTFGMGSSRWFNEEMNTLFRGVTQMTYSYRIELAGYAWGDRANWHSAYTWFANDFSFFGVIIVMFFLGWLWSNAYKDSFNTGNVLAIGLTTLLVQMFLFLSCNNIVFANSHTFFAFLFYLIVWLVHRFIRMKNVDEIYG